MLLESRRFGIDAGGTRTILLLNEGGIVQKRVFPSVNPASVGDEAAEKNLGLLLRWLAQTGTDQSHFGWVGSAEVSLATLDRATSRMKRALEAAGIRAVVVLTNDACVPLLAPPLNGVGIAVVVGTGSVAIGCDATGAMVQCGGYEYLISDEGGGFDIGLQGLRAAACAYDGRRGDTALLGMARTMYKSDIPTIGRELALSPYPKQAVAAFAEYVCRAAAEGDLAANGIIEAATGDLVACIEVVLNKLNGPVRRVTICGSIPAHSAEYSRALRHKLGTAQPELEYMIVSDASHLALRLSERLPCMSDFDGPLDLLPHAVLSTRLL